MRSAPIRQRWSGSGIPNSPSGGRWCRRPALRWIRLPGMVTIRAARAVDAAAACDVLRRSIEALCIADHGNDPAILAAWLGNKPPENIAAWIARPDQTLLLAVAGERVLAVGAVPDPGEITLKYVAPEARFLGVSKALLVALEARA